MIMLSEIKYKTVLSLGCSNCVAHAYKVTLHRNDYWLTILPRQQILTDILPLIFVNYSAALEGLGILIFEVSVRHTTFCGTHLHEWSALHRDFYPITHTKSTKDRCPCPRRDKNPQFQQADGHRPTPYAARPLGSAFSHVVKLPCAFALLY